VKRADLVGDTTARERAGGRRDGDDRNVYERRLFMAPSSATTALIYL